MNTQTRRRLCYCQPSIRISTIGHVENNLLLIISIHSAVKLCNSTHIERFVKSWMLNYGDPIYSKEPVLADKLLRAAQLPSVRPLTLGCSCPLFQGLLHLCSLHTCVDINFYWFYELIGFVRDIPDKLHIGVY